MSDLVSLYSHALSFASLSMVRNTEHLTGANHTVFQLFELRAVIRRRGEGKGGAFQNASSAATDRIREIGGSRTLDV